MGFNWAFKGLINIIIIIIIIIILRTRLAKIFRIRDEVLFRELAVCSLSIFV
jgi:hypothetical protein